MMTPPRSKRVSECPTAPVRKRKMTVLSDHADLGILPGDFVKPDPALTQRETRVYLLKELHRWLTGRICEHAGDIREVYENGQRVDLVSYISGSWPAARMYILFRLLESRASSYPWIKEEKPFRAIGEWATTVCMKYLQGEIDTSDSTAMLVVGFVAHDTLPCGRTIESFWNHSPFDVLRNAPPLTDEEDEDEDEDEDEEDSYMVKDSLEANDLGPALLFTLMLIVVATFYVVAIWIWLIEIYKAILA